MCGKIVLSKKGMNTMRRTYLALSDEDKDYLKTLSKKRTIQAQIVDRAKILLYKSEGMTFSDIAEKLAVSSATVRLCVSKYYEGGVENALFDTQRPGRPSEITDDAKAWIINIACQRPLELGYAQELWTLTSLHRHIQKHAEEAGYPRLSTITKPYIQKFLKEQDINHLRSSIIVKNEILILNQKCMKFSWFTNRLKCSLMKKVRSLFRMIIN